MGQRSSRKPPQNPRISSPRAKRTRQSNKVAEPLLMSVFSTSLGWFTAVGRDKDLVSLTVGHESAIAARTAALQQIEEWELGALDGELDWSPQLRKKLVEYAAGKKVKFDDTQLGLPKLTEFQRRVLEQTRKIGYGRTLSYGELAQRAGFPRAARGVGTVMAHNRFPVIIPCHRVIASQGKLGGYSGPQGVCLKAQLLTLERNGGK